MNRVRRRALALGLDTSHFTGQRTWSDEKLRQAVASSDSWTEVLRRLDINDNEDARIIVRGHAARLSLDVARFDPPPAEAVDFGQQPPTRDMLRFAGEAIATAWFALRGIPVAVPSQPAAYDLMATFVDGPKRVQVKTCCRRGRYGSWCVGIGQRPYSLDKTAGRRPYDPDSLDYFFIIDADGSIYLIPARVVGGRTTISVGAYEAYIVGRCADLLDGANSEASR